MNKVYFLVRLSNEMHAAGLSICLSLISIIQRPPAFEMSTPLQLIGSDGLISYQLLTRLGTSVTIELELRMRESCRGLCHCEVSLSLQGGLT